MATTITVTFVDQAAYDEMIRCVCIADGYQSEIPDPENPEGTIPNPQSQDDFVSGRVAGFLTEKQYHVQLQEKADQVPPPDPGIVDPSEARATS